MRSSWKSQAVRLLVVAIIWFGGLAALVFAQQPATTGPNSASPKPQTETTPAGYAGTSTCAGCHQSAAESVSKTVHSGTYDEMPGAALKNSSTSSCDGCHGSGKAHAEAELEAERTDTKNPQAKKLIFNFLAKDTTPEMINQRCLTCHANGPAHINSPNSFHRLNDVSCISCHSPHHATISEKLLIKDQPALCYGCHLQQRAQFNMPFRHRVNDGLIKCTDCHDQHGTAGAWESDHLVRQVRTSDSGDYRCFKCHADKQGPFVFAHAAVKVEGCATCHLPHGGANPHMLKYSNVNLLCLQCHTAAAFGHTSGTGFPVMDAQNSTQQQACTLCHVKIHGSNFSNLLFR
jgi:DmsE family decaheme c-type cytochrome